MPAEQIASAALSSGVSSVETVEPVAAALAQARLAAGVSGIVVVTGSLFVVAEALA